MERRRPPSEPEEMHRNVLPRGLPGSAIVWIVPRDRKVVPAQWRARHAPVSGVSRVPTMLDLASRISHQKKPGPKPGF